MTQHNTTNHDLQKRNIFKWTETHFREIPLEKRWVGGGATVLAFDCAAVQVYFVIVLQQHEIEKTFFFSANCQSFCVIFL